MTLLYRRHGPTMYTGARARYRTGTHGSETSIPSCTTGRAGGGWPPSHELGPIGRAVYRWWWGARPIPARVEGMLHSLLWRPGSRSTRMSDRHEVSAVVVGYDSTPEALAPTIASLLEQSLPPTQILCVDVSPDGAAGATLAERTARGGGHHTAAEHRVCGCVQPRCGPGRRRIRGVHQPGRGGRSALHRAIGGRLGAALGRGDRRRTGAASRPSLGERRRQRAAPDRPVLGWALRPAGRGRSRPAGRGRVGRRADGAPKRVRGSRRLHRWVLHVLRRRRPGLAGAARRLGGPVLSRRTRSARLPVREGQLQVALPGAQPLVVPARPSARENPCRARTVCSSRSKRPSVFARPPRAGWMPSSAPGGCSGGTGAAWPPGAARSSASARSATDRSSSA